MRRTMKQMADDATAESAARRKKAADNAAAVKLDIRATKQARTAAQQVLKRARSYYKWNHPDPAVRAEYRAARKKAAREAYKKAYLKVFGGEVPVRIFRPVTLKAALTARKAERAQTRPERQARARARDLARKKQWAKDHPEARANFLARHPNYDALYKHGYRVLNPRIQ
jgi:hypothetical protein